jgi:hypothetical protein
MTVDAQGEGRVVVAEVLGQLPHLHAVGEHHAGVVVAELMRAFFAGGDVALPAALVGPGGGDEPGSGECGLSYLFMEVRYRRCWPSLQRNSRLCVRAFPVSFS